MCAFAMERQRKCLLGHCPFCSKILTKYAPRGWAQRQLPPGTREDVYDYFRGCIASKTPPTQAQCRRYLEEKGSSLRWTRVKAIVNSKIKKEGKSTSNGTGKKRKTIRKKTEEKFKNQKYRVVTKDLDDPEIELYLPIMKGNQVPSRR